MGKKQRKVSHPGLKECEKLMHEIFGEIMKRVRAEDTGKIGALVKRKHEFLKVVKQILEVKS